MKEGAIILIRTYKMDKSNIDNLEKMIYECGGDYALGHSKRLIRLIEEISEEKDYNMDIIQFCAYTHDLGGFYPYAQDNIDHAFRSQEIVKDFINQYNFTNAEQEIIYEAILYHHSPGKLKSFEAILLRDADALEFLGFIGAARDITRAPKDLKKAIGSIQKHSETCMNNITLDKARQIADIRKKETDSFINRFLSESYNEY